MANAFQTTNAPPGNIRETLGTHYTTPVGSMASSREPNVLEPDEQELTRKARKREYDKAYRLKNLDRLQAQKQRYNDVHREEKRKRDRDYRQENRERLVVLNRAYYQENREQILAKQKEYGKAHPEVHLEASRRYVEKNREKQNAANKASRRKVRLAALAAYGEICACCGETEEAFLEVHHLNGGGNSHRRELGGSSRLYYWLKENNWPEGFGTLCTNCNKGTYKEGICPHKRMVVDSSEVAVRGTNKRQMYNSRWRKRRRMQVLNAYGNRCECCGETEEAFLEAHHKNGGGNKHRREIGGGAKMYTWIIKHGFPKEFGLLCAKCNKAEYHRGVCPHKKAALEGQAIN